MYFIEGLPDYVLRNNCYRNIKSAKCIGLYVIVITVQAAIRKNLCDDRNILVRLVIDLEWSSTRINQLKT